MKIKIIKCSKESYWYNTRVGEVFDVIDYFENDLECLYRVKTNHSNTDSTGYVLSKDCIVLSSIEQYNTLGSIVKQLESCKYVTEDTYHRLEDNIAFMSLKEMAKKEII